VLVETFISGRDDGIGNGLATMTAHGPVAAVDPGGEIQSAWHRQAAMEAGRPVSITC
jgi:hypothetical protein